MGEAAKGVKTHRRIDVIAKNCLAGLQFSREEALDTLSQKLVPESRVAFDACLYRSFEIASKWQGYVSFAFRAL